MISRFPIALFWLAIVAAVIVADLPHPLPVPGHPSDKLQHMLAFAGLTALAAWAYPRSRITTILLGLAFVGGVIELVQSLPRIGRDADFMDWLADVAGIAIVLVLVTDLREPLPRPGIIGSMGQDAARPGQTLLMVVLSAAIIATGIALAVRIDAAGTPRAGMHQHVVRHP